jgi:hypothetical protein
MNNESNEPLKVGDVCTIRLPTICPNCAAFNGTECTIEVDVRRALRMRCDTGLEVADVYACRRADGGIAYLQRCELIKKRPPADGSEWIRQVTVPRCDFDRWLEDVRQGTPVVETP